jgi:hypothetical protein
MAYMNDPALVGRTPLVAAVGPVVAGALTAALESAQRG